VAPAGQARGVIFQDMWSENISVPLRLDNLAGAYRKI
jgi:hypothetical protein